jgi:hypothetical protein
MENKFKEGSGLEQIVVHLLNDNIRLQSEMLALKGFLEMLSQNIDPNYDAAKVKLMQDALVESFQQRIIASHPLYSEWMKGQLKGLKGLGADFGD